MAAERREAESNTNNNILCNFFPILNYMFYEIYRNYGIIQMIQKSPVNAGLSRKINFLINNFFELQETDSAPEDKEKKPVNDEEAESDYISP